MELFHALNRGVDKRQIFMDDADRARFVHDMFEFNDQAPAGSVYYSFRRKQKNLDFVNPDMRRQRLVDIHGWCLMGNHYHLLISERTERGIPLFLRKLNVGYANYFNERHGRSGTLFQGRTKKVHIASDAHFLHILHYIHLNPLDYLKGAKDWRSLRIERAHDALAHLDAYRWSSYLDYCGKDNFPSVLTKDLFSDVFKQYRKTITLYIKDIEFGPIAPYLLE
jgi:putative transposase